MFISQCPFSELQFLLHPALPLFENQIESNTLKIVLFVSVIIAAIFPNLGPFLSLIGAFSLSIVGIIFPAITQTLVYMESPGLGRFYWRLWKNMLITVFGFVGLITGTMTSIKEFVHAVE